MDIPATSSGEAIDAARRARARRELLPAAEEAEPDPTPNPRANGYVETSFLPRPEFSSPEDFNAQLAEWLPRANARTVRSIHGRPWFSDEVHRSVIRAYVETLLDDVRRVIPQAVDREPLFEEGSAVMAAIA